MSKANRTTSIQYEEFQGNKFLVLHRDWAMRRKGELPDTEKCHFCGSKHRHGSSAGQRVPHCASGSKPKCIADDGTVLSRDDGYILRDLNRLAPPAGKLIVADSIRPVRASKRKPIDLKPGNSYYVSFAIREAFPCVLIKVEPAIDGVVSAILVDVYKIKGGHAVKERCGLSADQIGRTPEEAVQNMFSL